MPPIWACKTHDAALGHVKYTDHQCQRSHIIMRFFRLISFLFDEGGPKVSSVFQVVGVGVVVLVVDLWPRAPCTALAPIGPLVVQETHGQH